MRGLNEGERLSALERAIRAGNVQVLAAALEQPELSGLTPERADLLRGSWRRARCPEQIERLALLQRTAERVEQAATRLEARFAEAFDHCALDALEASTRAA